MKSGPVGWAVGVAAWVLPCASVGAEPASAQGAARESTEVNAGEESSPIEVAGFGDLLYVLGEARSSTGIHALELDLGASLGRAASAGIAVAYQAEENALGVGALTLELRLAGSDSRHLLDAAAVDSLGGIVGKFDVPFGIDRDMYAAIDRYLISTPLPVDALHGCWNAWGAQLFAQKGPAVATVFVAEPFAPADEQAADLASAAGDVATGARISLSPLPGLVWGASAALLLGTDSFAGAALLGSDFQFEFMRVAVRGEYIQLRRSDAAGGARRLHGAYGHLSHSWRRYLLVGRYDLLFGPDVDRRSSVSAGAGVRLLGGRVQLRSEYQRALETREHSAYLQLVLGFETHPTREVGVDP